MPLWSMIAEVFDNFVVSRLNARHILLRLLTFN
jgi:hypothetical protein